MIKTYIKLQFDSNGAKPSEVIRILKGVGCSPIIGDFDFEKSLRQGESLFEALDSIHEALRGTGVQYSVTTRTVPDSDADRKEERAGAVRKSEKPDLEERVLESVGKNGSTALSLSKKLSVPKSEVESALEKLVESGTLLKKKRGRYHIYLKK